MSHDTDPVHVIPAQRQLRTSRGRWRAAAFVLAALMIVAVVGRFAWPNADQGEDHIGRVILSGTITTDAARLREIDAMAEDEKVKAVIVAINSPGGTTAGGEELFEVLARVRAQKPVVAVIDELGASGAYMTAIGADWIIARRLSIVGSIGVFFAHVDAGKLMETIGIDYDKVQTGPLKAEPDIDEPLTGLPRASLQRLVDDSFEWFVDAVAERRGMARADVMELADGRVVTGRMAQAAGLIDALGGEHEAIAWLESEKELAEDLPVYTHYPRPEEGLDRLLRLAGAQALSAVGLDRAPGVVLDGLVSLWQAENLDG